MAMGHRARHALIFVVVIVIWRIVTRHQHGYGDGVGNGNGNGYGNAARQRQQGYNNQPQDRRGWDRTTAKTVGTAPPPTMDCGMTSANDGYD
jgi:hypothetical protein